MFWVSFSDSGARQNITKLYLKAIYSSAYFQKQYPISLKVCFMAQKLVRPNEMESLQNLTAHYDFENQTGTKLFTYIMILT